MSAPARHLHIAHINDHPAPVDSVRQELALLRASNSELEAYVRATIAAARDGWADPLAILIGLVEKRGQMPRPDQTPSALLALVYVDGGR